MNTKNFIDIYILIYLILIPSLLFADSNIIKKNFCNNELVKCLNNKSKNSCYLKLSENTNCKDTTLGKLSYKRWEASPDKGNKLEQKEYKAKLDSSYILNHNCLAEFDNTLLSLLLNESFESSDNSTLFKKLNSCKLELSENYFNNN